MRVAVIGAGMAGLTAADALKKGGLDVCLFDKGRGPGGRMSTRRAQVLGKTLRFDHGAQYISPRTADFEAEVARWVEAGVAAAWTGQFVEIDANGETNLRPSKPVYVGTPGMNEIIRYLASGHKVEWGRRVRSVTHESTWNITFEDGETHKGFDCVISAVPAEQVSDLFSSASPSLADLAASVKSDPCWTAMVAFEKGLDVEWDGASILNSPVAWAARNSSKPNRGAPDETWVLQASAEWSAANLEEEKNNISSALLLAFQSITNASDPIFVDAHRWRYSQVRPKDANLFYFEEHSKLGACGDWCSGPKIEDAWLSGRALAQAVLD
ncbi:MAG: FAD-dependent oxidoreductase [Pseudomonadota bacterium]